MVVVVPEAVLQRSVAVGVGALGEGSLAVERGAAAWLAGKRSRACSNVDDSIRFLRRAALVAISRLARRREHQLVMVGEMFEVLLNDVPHGFKRGVAPHRDGNNRRSSE